MSAWVFDMTAAPTDAPVWLASQCGKVIKSQWLEKTKFSPARWSGLASQESPIAWQPYIVPAHPGTRSDLGLDIVTKHSEINVPIIDDVGCGA